MAALPPRPSRDRSLRGCLSRPVTGWGCRRVPTGLGSGLGQPAERRGGLRSCADAPRKAARPPLSPTAVSESQQDEARTALRAGQAGVSLGARAAVRPDLGRLWTAAAGGGDPERLCGRASQRGLGLGAVCQGRCGGRPRIRAGTPGP